MTRQAHHKFGPCALRALAPFLFVILAACRKEAAPQGKAGRAGLAFATDVMAVESKKAAYLVSAPGTIDAFERVQVTARVAGAVDRVAFTEGQEVKKGTLLVVIDSERFGLLVNSAKAAIDKANVAVADADAMIKRREAATAQNPGLITGEEIESLRNKKHSAEADRQVAAASLATAQVNLRDSSVRAPIDGIIQTRTIETGQYVPAGYVMATLLRRNPMLVRFQVEPQDAPRLKSGMVATFALRETLRKFTARLTLIAGAADSVTHMVPVTGEIVDEGHAYWLRPGSFCDVSIELDAQREAPIIPRTAARATDHGYVAYVVEGDVAKERILTLGMSTKDGWVEVRSGLSAGDRLVVRGAEALVNGAKVKVNPVTAATLASGGSPPGSPRPSGSGAPGEGAAGRRRPAASSGGTENVGAP